MTKLRRGAHPCTCGRAHHATKLVAITGGPGAGKTAVLEMALRSFCAHVAVLPEAASVVFGGGFPRHASDAGREAAQRAIFHVQREAERLVVEEGEVAVALCDRGTVDGTAYWPGDPATLFSAVGTTRQEELDRYAVVIHLETPEASQGYNHENALRVESAKEAAELDRRVREAWLGHPRHHVVSSADDFVEKARRSLELIRGVLPPCCHTHELTTER